MVDELGESGPQLPESLKDLVEERKKLFQTFSLDDFQLRESSQGEPYAQITLPEAVAQGENPFTERLNFHLFALKILIKAQGLDETIRQYASKHGLSELEEIDIRQDPVIAAAFDKAFGLADREVGKDYVAEENGALQVWMQIFFRNALNTAFEKVRPPVGDTREFHAWMLDPKAREIEDRVSHLRTCISYGEGISRFAVLDSKGNVLFKTPSGLEIAVSPETK